jgi:uncharacterized protein YkwD
MNAYLRPPIALTLFAAFLACTQPAASQAPDEEKGKAVKAPAEEPLRMMSEEEKALFEAVNAFRRTAVTKDNKPLVADANLIKGSRAQATAMARKAEINEAAGIAGFNRVVGAGFAKERVVKIDAWTEGFATPETVLEVLLKDKKNRAQLLDPSFRAAGVGIIRTNRNEFYYTVTLLSPE